MTVHAVVVRLLDPPVDVDWRSVRSPALRPWRSRQVELLTVIPAFMVVYDILDGSSCDLLMKSN